MKDNSQNNLPETKNLILEREHSVPVSLYTSDAADDP